MPKSPIHKCLACAQLSTTEARHLHGPQADDCWDASRCHRRRSYYRNRPHINAKRRARYATQTVIADPTPTLITPQPPCAPVALLYLYRDPRKDSPLHALAISVWQGESKLAETTPIHCLGMTNRQVNTYLKQVLEILKQQYNIKQFEPPIQRLPIECPLTPCPLKSESVA
ncbi:MAG: hypothetical protein AAGE92_07400 [Cyanobacteria bacterium P01_G01_bin.4]